MSSESDSGLFFIKPPELAIGRVMLTPGGPQPYKVIFRIGDTILSEYPVPSVREGEALIRRELLEMQFAARQQRPNPEAPKRPAQ